MNYQTVVTHKHAFADFRCQNINVNGEVNNDAKGLNYTNKYNDSDYDQ